MRKRRILFTSFGWSESGGGTILARELGRELSRRGNDIAVFYASTVAHGSKPYATSVTTEGAISLHAVHNRPSPILDVGYPDRDIEHRPVRAYFGQVLDTFRPDLVHCHNLHNLGASLLEETQMRGIPVVLTPHNYWFMCARAHLETGRRRPCHGADHEGLNCALCAGDERLASGYRRRNEYLLDVTRRCVTHVAAPSAAIADAFVLMGAKDVSAIRQSLPWIRDLWATSGLARAACPVIRATSEPLELLALGSARTHKGLLLAAQAAADVGGVRLNVLGDPSARLLQEIRAIDRRGNVRLTGSYHPGSLVARIQSAHCAVALSTVLETGPFSVLEAFAAGLPVLGTNVGGIPEVVRHLIDGLIVPPRSVEAVRAAIRSLRDDPTLAARLQSNIEQPRYWEEYVDDVLDVYNGAAGTHHSVVTRGVRWLGKEGDPFRHALQSVGVGIATGDDDSNLMLVALPQAEVRVSPGCPTEAAVGIPVVLLDTSGQPDLVPGWVAAGDSIDGIAVSNDIAAAAYVRAGFNPTKVHLIPGGSSAVVGHALRAAIDSAVRRYADRKRGR